MGVGQGPLPCPPPLRGRGGPEGGGVLSREAGEDRGGGLLYRDNCSRTASSTAASASGRFSGCLPPACAKSGRPPPPPPTMGDRRLTSSPALIRGVRSLVTAATRL